MTADRTADRIAALERRLRRTQAVAGAACAGVLVLALAGWRPPPAVQELVRARSLVNEDSAGAERFGVGLNADGSVSMGFDAPAGHGRRGNRERLTTVVVHPR